jgi:hypothetical protein
MDESDSRSRAALGFTVKSGWAAAVLLTGSPKSPRVADSRRIELSDPAIPEARQPYHAGFGTARASGPELLRLLRSVRRFGKESVTELIRHYKTSGQQLAGVGIVVGSLIDPERIANDHIRIHALEGQLFRRVVEGAAAGSALPCSVWRERDLYSLAAAPLRQPEQQLRATLAALKGAVAGSWRAEQKVAALAAWLVLAARGNATRSRRGECQRPPPNGDS